MTQLMDGVSRPARSRVQVPQVHRQTIPCASNPDLVTSLDQGLSLWRSSDPSREAEPMDITMPGCFRRRWGALVRTSGCSTNERRPHVLAVEVLGWVGSALWSTRCCRSGFCVCDCSTASRRRCWCVDAAIGVWPMVALNVTLTAIDVLYTVRLLRGRHDAHTFEVVEILQRGLPGAPPARVRR